MEIIADWDGLSDYVAVVRTSENSLAWEPLYHNQATGEAFLKRDGEWLAVARVEGIERYQELKPLKPKIKTHFDTATLETVELLN